MDLQGIPSMVLTRPVTSLRRQGGEEFSESVQIFKKYVQ